MTGHWAKSWVSLSGNKLNWGLTLASHIPKPLVYVVDDDDAVRDSLDLYLTLKGMDVTIFGSAQELLDHDEGVPQILVLDVNMPGMDGIMLLETLRERGHAEPAVLITGLGDPEIRARAERAGAAAFFDKPIDPPVLFSALTRLLSAAHA